MVEWWLGCRLVSFAKVKRSEGNMFPVLPKSSEHTLDARLPRHQTPARRSPAVVWSTPTALARLLLKQLIVWTTSPMGKGYSPTLTEIDFCHGARCLHHVIPSFFLGGWHAYFSFLVLYEPGTSPVDRPGSPSLSSSHSNI